MHEFTTEWYAFLHPPAAQPEKLQINVNPQQFPFIAQGRGIQIQGFSLVVRTNSSINSLAAQVDPGTGGASVFQPKFAPPDQNGFHTAQQNGRLALTLDPTQPLVVDIGTKSGQFNTLTDGDVLDCYLLIEYTLE